MLRVYGSIVMVRLGIWALALKAEAGKILRI